MPASKLKAPIPIVLPTPPDRAPSVVKSQFPAIATPPDTGETPVPFDALFTTMVTTLSQIAHQWDDYVVCAQLQTATACYATQPGTAWGLTIACLERLANVAIVSR